MLIPFACLVCFVVCGASQPEVADAPADNHAVAEATPIESLTLDFGKLPKEARYKIGRIGPNNSVIDVRGTIVSTTNVQDSVVRMEDVFTSESGDVTGSLKETCAKDSLLTLQKAEGDAPGDDDSEDFTVVVEEGKAKHQTKSGASSETPFAKGSITRSAFTRIVGLLPRDKGKSYSFAHLLRPDKYKAGDGPYVVTCMGEEPLDRGAGDVTCTKFELRSEKNKNRGPIVVFLVGTDGLLQRMIYDGREITDLTTETEGSK